MMDVRFTYLFMIAITLSVGTAENAEKCGYVRRPLAATNDTVVINLDCDQSPISHDINLHLGDNATHVAVQLLQAVTRYLSVCLLTSPIT